MTTPTATTILNAIRADRSYHSLKISEGSPLCDLDDSALFTVHVNVYNKKGNKTALAAMMQIVVDAGLLVASPYRLRTPRNRFNPYKNCVLYTITAAGLAV